MDMYGGAAHLMAMDETTWRRHANPWSVWTRFTCLPLIVLAIWSRVWLGWWALLPLAAALAWTWVNPRVFAPPARLDSWASRGVMGERLFIARVRTPIPGHHVRPALILTGLSGIGAAIMLWGLVMLDAWPTLTGLVIAILGKVWFADRMVWLFDEMRRDGAPEVAAMLRP